MKRAFSAIIIDDEQDAIDLIIARLSIIRDDIEVLGCFSTWQEGLKALRTLSPQIIFMDISMPGKNGIDLLKLVPDFNAEVIFITAHEEYALQVFEFSTSGYILKPVDDIELSKCIDRAIKRLHAQNTPGTENYRIGIPDNKGISYINLSDIEYLESVSGYTKVVTNYGTILSSINLGRFKDAVNNTQFCQVHRSYIVNINAVNRYMSTGEILMRDGKEIPVSKSYKEHFLSLFNVVTKSVVK